MGQNVTLQVDSRGDFHQFKAFGAELEYAALGDIDHVLALRGGQLAVEGQVFHLIDEFHRFAVADDV